MIGTLIGGAIGALGSIYGGYKASQAMKGVQRDLEKQRAENRTWYDRRYNEDATQRADAQRILNITAQNIKDRNRAAAGAAAVMGGTTESVAAAKAANNEALADAVSRIAVAGENRKDDIERRYLDTESGLRGQLNDMERQKASAISQAAGGVAQAAGAAGAAYDQQKLDLLKLAQGAI